MNPHLCASTTCVQRRGADDDDGSDGEEERGERSTLRTHSKTGPGGLPHQSDAKAYLARGTRASRVRAVYLRPWLLRQRGRLCEPGLPVGLPHPLQRMV